MKRKTKALPPVTREMVINTRQRLIEALPQMPDAAAIGRLADTIKWCDERLADESLV